MRFRSLLGALVGTVVLACGSSGSDTGLGSGGTGGGGGGSGGGSGDGGLTCDPACGAGLWCNPATGKCESGCNGDSDCSGATPHCDPATHQCQGCTEDTHCPAGEVCSSGSCTQGCSASQPCDAGRTCCNGSCHDLSSDPTSCGTCGTACTPPANASATCVGGSCKLGACDTGYSDCDGDGANGCETQGSCVCTPGATQACYEGPSGTENVGLCVGGTQTCNPTGDGWGPCQGQVLPVSEVCANSLDDDCNGTPDDVTDIDGDGWTKCEGDCCELTFECSKPSAVNPGAYEYPGNQVDDDCDPATDDNPKQPCSSTAIFTGVTPEEVAKAIDLCEFTTANPPLNQKKWGVISAEFLLADGSAPSAARLTDMQNSQAAVLQDYGTGGIAPKMGPTFAGISSGKMRDQNDTGYVNPNGGTSFPNGYSQPPAAYLAAHGGALPASAGCSGNCPAGSGANDPVNVRLTIRVPTNAQSFSYQFRFFSSEYWSWQCTSYNDFYLALLQTGAAGIPADKNISFDSNNNPVSVNNGFFDLCAVKGCNTCPAGMGELAGTGMEVGNTGGGTVWLTTTAPIVPGETMQIEFMVFDVSDGILDSLTILDNFLWKIDPSQVGTTDG